MLPALETELTSLKKKRSELEGLAAKSSAFLLAEGRRSSWRLFPALLSSPGAGRGVGGAAGVRGAGILTPNLLLRRVAEEADVCKSRAVRLAMPSTPLRQSLLF